jgi:hypothetical protein
MINVHKSQITVYSDKIAECESKTKPMRYKTCYQITSLKIPEEYQKKAYLYISFIFDSSYFSKIKVKEQPI